MSALQMFVTVDELTQIIRSFAHRRGLSGVVQTTEGYQRFDPKVMPSDLVSQRSVEKIYLFPHEQGEERPLTEEAVQPRNWGWIDIWPGRLMERKDQRILIMTTIQAVDSQYLPFKPATWLRRLRKDLSYLLTFGVKGINVIYGSQHVYADTGYSQEALHLHYIGVRWKQFEDGNVEFIPL